MTDTTTFTIELGPGDGLVAAQGDIAVLLRGAGDDGPVLAAVRDAAAATGPSTKALARRLAGLLTSDLADDVPDIGAISDTDAGLLVFVAGAVEAVARRADGSEVRLSGADAATWVDRIFGDDVVEVVLSAAGTADTVGTSRFELRDGVVPGGWLRRVRSSGGVPTAAPDPGTAPAPIPEPSHATPGTPDAAPDATAAATPVAPPVPPSPAAPVGAAAPVAPATPPTPPIEVADDEPTAPFESVVLSGPAADPATEVREPLPLDADDAVEAAEAADATSEEHLVHGILCSRQHFNSPDTSYCTSCGISMVHQTHNLVRRRRPPLGFLVFDDGSTFTLDEHYVLGREPEIDPLVTQGTARPICLDDANMTVSRVHADIRLEGWEVQLTDRNSTNGSYLLNDAGTDWERLAPGQSRRVPPGGRGAVGQRTFVYETPQRGGAA